MFFISGGMLLVYLLSLLFPPLTGLLSLDRAALFRGQVWRLLTFLFVPPTTSPLWILFQLYFNCLLGRGLEQQWGVFRFNLYYLCGMVGAILAALLTGYGTNNYLNLSLFFAFAAFYPDYKLLIFFILPVKIKYLAILDGVLDVYKRQHMMKQRACNTIPAAVFFRINGADVGRQILSIVKIIFNDSQPSDDSVARHGQIPLRHNTIPGKAVLHTLQIRIQRNPPFFVKPLRCV